MLLLGRPTGLSLRTSRRVGEVSCRFDEAWSVAAGAGPGRHWYVDAAPFVVRGALDRLLLGEGRRWPVPAGPLLRAGDRAGFWEVRAAGPTSTGHRLVLEAAVRAPGRVLLRLLLHDRGDRCGTDLRIGFEPRGLLGAAYLLSDVPAREIVTELTHRRLLAEVADPSRASGA